MAALWRQQHRRHGESGTVSVGTETHQYGGRNTTSMKTETPSVWRQKHHQYEDRNTISIEVETPSVCRQKHHQYARQL
jgi:flagellar basal body rod protein FlgB